MPMHASFVHDFRKHARQLRACVPQLLFLFLILLIYKLLERKEEEEYREPDRATASFASNQGKKYNSTVVIDEYGR